MHLGVFVLGTGNHSAEWRYDGAATSNNDLLVIQEIARHAERGKFDLLFVSAGSQASKPSAGMMRAGIARPESTPCPGSSSVGSAAARGVLVRRDIAEA
jgi:hypothetical protein